MKARIKFSKAGAMKFIGHLDVMRYFQKAFRRSEVKIEYSKGFSPHQLISFAAPLGVGLTSDSEYLDIVVTDSGSSKEMVDQINKVMTEGFHVLSFKKLDEDSKNAMSIVAAADYLVSLKDGYELVEDFQKKFTRFLNQDSITILKKTKKSEVLMDIKPFIYYFSFDKADFNKQADTYGNRVTLYLRLATGSVTNIKPELVMEAFCQYIGIAFNKYAWGYHRLEVYANMGKDDEREFVPLDDLGTEVL